MRRDGHRAARKRNDEFGFCLTLKSSLTFRKDFPLSFAYKGWDFPASDKTGFRKSQGKVTPTFSAGEGHSHIQCPLPIAGALQCKRKMVF